MTERPAASSSSPVSQYQRHSKLHASKKFGPVRIMREFRTATNGKATERQQLHHRFQKFSFSIGHVGHRSARDGTFLPMTHLEREKFQ